MFRSFHIVWVLWFFLSSMTYTYTLFLKKTVTSVFPFSLELNFTGMVKSCFLTTIVSNDVSTILGCSPLFVISLFIIYGANLSK